MQRGSWSLDHDMCGTGCRHNNAFVTSLAVQLHPTNTYGETSKTAAGPLLENIKIYIIDRARRLTPFVAFEIFFLFQSPLVFPTLLVLQSLLLFAPLHASAQPVPKQHFSQMTRRLHAAAVFPRHHREAVRLGCEGSLELPVRRAEDASNYSG